MGTISKNFSYSEFEVTDVAELRVKNKITSVEVRDNIKSLVDEVLQPLRYSWGFPLAINSGYRCEEVNKAAEGAATSQHRKGEAADVCPFGRNGHGDVKVVRELAKRVLERGLPFDQMGLYGSFVHLSHKRDGKQRGQIFYDKSYKGEKI